MKAFLDIAASGSLRLYSTSELLELPPPEWQVEPIFPKRGFVVLFGQPGTAKSFIALDLLASICLGKPWQGHKTGSPTFGVYVAAEGGVGMSRRMMAWMVEHGIEDDANRIAWLLQPIDVYGDSEQLQTLADTILHIWGRMPDIIVIDTLARCFDGDENQQEDMGRFIKGVDKLRHDFKATVVVVHHTNLGGERERGNTALRGAADAMMKVEGDPNDGPVTFSCDKQKDAEAFEDIKLVLKGIEGTDSACIVATPTSRAASVQLKTSELLALVRANEPVSYSRLKELVGLRMSPATLKRRLTSLKSTGEIAKEIGNYRVSRAHETGKINSEPKG